MGTAVRDGGHPARALLSAALPAGASQLWFLVLPPFLPTMADAFGVSPALAGQIIGLPVLLAAALIPVVGPLIDAYGHARVMTLGLAAIAVSSFGTALATSSGLLLAARLVGSFGRAGVIPAAFVDAVERPSQDQRRQGTGWVSIGAASAPLIGVPLLTLVGVNAGWRSAFVLVGLLGALSAVLAWRQDRSQPRVPGRASAPTLRSFRPLLSEPAIMSVLVSSLVGNSAIWVGLAYLGVLYQTHLGLGPQDTGWALTAIGVGQLAGALSATDQRVGRASRGLLAACRVGVGLMWGLPFLVPVGAAGVAVLLAGGGVLTGVLTPITPLILNQQPRSDTGTVQSLNWLALTAGIALGTSLGGALLTIGDLFFVGLGTLGFSVVSAMVLFWPDPAGLTLGTRSQISEPTRAPFGPGQRAPGDASRKL